MLGDGVFDGTDAIAMLPFVALGRFGHAIFEYQVAHEGIETVDEDESIPRFYRQRDEFGFLALGQASIALSSMFPNFVYTSAVKRNS